MLMSSVLTPITFTQNRQISLPTLTSLLAIGLAACGGGGGSSERTPSRAETLTFNNPNARPAEAPVISDYNSETDLIDVPSGTVLTVVANSNASHLQNSQGDTLLTVTGTGDADRLMNEFNVGDVRFLIGTDSANTLTASSNQQHYIRGKGGDDVLTGGDQTDFIYGEAGDDELNGGAGSDALIGGAGNDILIGGFGYGIDEMIGGSGNDQFVFDFMPTKLILDFIYDSSPAGERDKIRIDLIHFVMLQGASLEEATNAVQTIKLSLNSLAPEHKLEALLTGLQVGVDNQQNVEGSAGNDIIFFPSLEHDSSYNGETPLMVLVDFSQELTFDMFELV